jgi:hypothetical protein
MRLVKEDANEVAIAEHNPDPENIPLCINPSTAEVWAVPIHV